MTIPKEPQSLTELKQRCHHAEQDFRVGENTVCLFSAAASKHANKINYADMTLPDRFVDVLFRRKSKSFSWQEIRAGWLSVLRELSDKKQLSALYFRMQKELEAAKKQPQDFVWLIQDTITRSLLPHLINDLSIKHRDTLFEDHHNKLAFLLDEEEQALSFKQKIKNHYHSIRAANIFRSTIKKRANGQLPRQRDLLDPLVDMLPRLGIDRAVDVMATLHTAVNGPPGAAAACLAYELERHPEWEKRLQQEFSNLPFNDFVTNPMKSAPLTLAFVKEVLRMWNVPMLVRQARTEFSVDEHQLKQGDIFLLSPYFIHRDPGNWNNPNTFEPKRWLDNTGVPKPGSYVPFGWAPKSCIGAQLGTLQLMLLAHLLCTQFKLVVSDKSKLNIMMAALPQPTNFNGHVRLRRNKEYHEVFRQ